MRIIRFTKRPTTQPSKYAPIAMPDTNPVPLCQSVLNTSHHLGNCQMRQMIVIVPAIIDILLKLLINLTLLKYPINALMDYSNCYYNPNHKGVCHKIKSNQGIDQYFKFNLKC